MTRDESVATNGDRVNTFSYYNETSVVMFCNTDQMPVCSLVSMYSPCLLRMGTASCYYFAAYFFSEPGSECPVSID